MARGENPPEHLPADLRTRIIAMDEAGSWCLTAGSIQAALLAEMVGALHEAGALPGPAVTALAERWQSVLTGWKGGSPELQTHLLITASDLAAEMAWRFPSLLPPAPSTPTRVGRKRRPHADHSEQE